MQAHEPLEDVRGESSRAAQKAAESDPAGAARSEQGGTRPRHSHADAPLLHDFTADNDADTAGGGENFFISALAALSPLSVGILYPPELCVAAPHVGIHHAAANPRASAETPKTAAPQPVQPLLPPGAAPGPGTDGGAIAHHLHLGHLAHLADTLRLHPHHHDHGQPADDSGAATMHPRFDLVESPGAFFVVGELPGLAQSAAEHDVRVEVNEALATVTVAGRLDCARPASTSKPDAEPDTGPIAELVWHVHEHQAGRFLRVFHFSHEEAALAQVSARARDGLLTVEVPKAKTPAKAAEAGGSRGEQGAGDDQMPRTIDIAYGPGSGAVDGR